MKGIYCLIINIKKKTLLKIGALGKIEFKKGRYIYIGSAQNNLKRRIQRHLSKKKKIRWHIDYLLSNPHVIIEEIKYKKGRKKDECQLAHFLSSFEEPVKGFGSSDCKCHSHLFKLMSMDYFTKKKFRKLNNIEIEGNEITIGCRK